MEKHPDIGDIYKWPSQDPKYLLVVDFVDKQDLMEEVCVCLELGREEWYHKVRSADLEKIAKRMAYVSDERNNLSC